MLPHDKPGETAGVRVAILVNNPCVFDSRVIRAAEILAGEGFRVRVFCRTGDDAPDFESRNSVDYVRLPWLGPVAAVRTLLFPRRRASATATDVDGAMTPPADAGAGHPSPGAALAVPWLFRPLKSLFGRHVADLHVHLEVAAVMDRGLRAFRPDVIHANDLETLPVAAATARELNSRLVYDAHEIAVEEYDTLSPVTRAWRRRQERRLIRRADRVVTTSDGFADYLERHYGIARPTVIFNAPAVDPDAPRKPGVREALGLPSEVPLVVFTGMLRFDRGLENILNALALCPGFHFARVGPGNERYDRAARTLAERLGIADRVHLLPRVDPHEVPHYVAGADLAVIANRNLTLNFDLAMPNKLFEAALAGLPLAVARLKGCSDFVLEHGLGMVMDETDPEDMARVIAAVYERRARFAPTPEKRRELVRYYGWQAQARLLVALYRGLPSMPSV